MASKTNSTKKKKWIARVVLCLILVTALLVSLFWTENINRALGLSKVTESSYDGNSREEALGDETVLALGGDLNVHFVDVGQGDACIVELPDQKTMIIDGGKDKEKTKLLSYIDDLNTTNAEKNKETIEVFDYAILTHSDEDHCGGLDDVLLSYPAKTFYRPNVLATHKDYIDPAAATILAQNKHNSHNTLAYKRALEAGYNADKKKDVTTQVVLTDANDAQTALIKPEGLSPQDANYYEINFYAPTVPYFSDVNDYSPIMILSYQGKRIALSGDAEKAAETEFISRVDKAKTDGITDKYDVFTDTFSVDVIKLGHHGSDTSSSRGYLETLTSPQSTSGVLAVISCALDNSYGHPSPETLSTLNALGFSSNNILSTSSNGSIALSVRPITDEASGEVRYELFFGADLKRAETAALSLGPVDMQWREIVFTLCLLSVLVLIVAPLIQDIKCQAKKAARKSRRR